VIFTPLVSNFCCYSRSFDCKNAKYNIFKEIWLPEHSRERKLDETRKNLALVMWLCRAPSNNAPEPKWKAAWFEFKLPWSWDSYNHVLVDILSNIFENLVRRYNIPVRQNVLQCIGDWILGLDCRACSRIHLTLHSIYREAYYIVLNIFRVAFIFLTAERVLEKLLRKRQYVVSAKYAFKRLDSTHRYWR